MSFFKKIGAFLKKEFPTDPKLLRREIRDYILITFFLSTYTLGVVAFIVKSEIVGGGVAGIGTLIYYATGIPVAISTFVINGVLLIIGFKVLGKGFGFKTIYAVIMASLFIGMWTAIIREPILKDDPFLSVVVAGLIVGFSIGMAFRYGGSTGGTDIVALIVAKYRNVGPGKVILFCDAIIISSSFFVFYFCKGATVIESIRVVIYGVMLTFVYTTVVDMVVVGGQASVQIFINSSKYKEIAEMITHEKNRGVTLLQGEKYYSQTETQVLWVVARKYELQGILRRVRDIDPDAFMSITNTSGVYGKGFANVK